MTTSVPIAWMVLCGLALSGAPLRGEAQQRARAEPLPEGQLFQPLDADPKQPHFFAAWLWTTSPLVTGQIASVGLGEDIGIIRGPGAGRGGRRWQVSVAAGVFSQFNVQTPSNDLLNTDFVVGFPFTWRSGALSARARIYHQSSHLGDEFILKTNPTRVNLSFEALELLLARDLGRFRAYGGGEYIVRHEPADLKPGLIHFGAEYRHARALLRVGGLGDGRLVAGLDAKSSQERKWQTGWSMFAGLEFQPSSGVRHLSIELQGYDGPAPYGQFYLENVQSVGFGLHFSL